MLFGMFPAERVFAGLVRAGQTVWDEDGPVEVTEVEDLRASTGDPQWEGMLRFHGVATWTGMPCEITCHEIDDLDVVTAATFRAAAEAAPLVLEQLGLPQRGK